MQQASSIFRSRDDNKQIDFNEFMIALTMTGRKDAVGKLKLAFQIYDVGQWTWSNVLQSLQNRKF